MSQQQEFAKRLKALRTAKGLTQRQLAGTELSVSYVSLLEAGRRTPTAETVKVLADSLGCAPEELWSGTGSVVDSRPPGSLSLRYGQLALASGQIDQAADHFEIALKAPDLDDLGRTEAAIGSARVLEAQGRLREAARAYANFSDFLPSILSIKLILKFWIQGDDVKAMLKVSFFGDIKNF